MDDKVGELKKGAPLLIGGTFVGKYKLGGEFLSMEPLFSKLLIELVSKTLG